MELNCTKCFYFILYGFVQISTALAIVLQLYSQSFSYKKQSEQELLIGMINCIADPAKIAHRNSVRLRLVCKSKTKCIFLYVFIQAHHVSPRKLLTFTFCLPDEALLQFLTFLKTFILFFFLFLFAINFIFLPSVQRQLQ